MGFAIAQRALERLEWPEILARLAREAGTPRGRARILAPAEGGVSGTALFEPDAAGVRERLAETREALAVLGAGEAPPLGGVAEIGPALVRARKGGALPAADLLEVAAALAALHATRRFLRARQGAAPRLGRLGEQLPEHPALWSELDASLDPNGEVRDAASAALAEARADARRLAAEIQGRLSRILHDPALRDALQDAYFTVRNDRYVLPVRADARAAVRGIVHDASRSGTTLFVEPDALVEANNRHKQAELAVEQETLRVLRDLSRGVADAADSIDAGLTRLADVDLAFARARLASAQRAVEPEVGEAGALRLPQLRHPLLPEREAVPNDIRLGEDFQVLVLSGPNAGGKTVAMKSVALAALFARAGLFVPAAAPARVDLFGAVLADIGDEQDIREHLSTFSARMANLARIVEQAESAPAGALVVIDEVGSGTDPGEGAALAQAALETLADRGARVVATTHHGLLKEMAEVDPRFANASVEFDPDSLAPTYRLRMGLAGVSSAIAVAARMGVPRAVLDRADEILSREDRRLDQILGELASSRAALEREQREARRLRDESEAVRGQYREKLERLQERRDGLVREMRADLDRALREAHEEIRSVVRDLQRGGASARDAARAREQVIAIEARARDTGPLAEAVAAEAPRLAPVDWSRARPGDPVSVADGAAAVLLALPDRRGRVAVQLGSARVVLPLERVGAAAGPPARDAGGPRVAFHPDADAGAAEPRGAGASLAALPDRCDLRGLRVDEAMDRLAAALDHALAAGCDEVVVVHGLGTGALRRATREHLRSSPCVAGFQPGAPEEGGEGTTRVRLAR